MSRIPCNVNKDLLPLYVDDVCSEESKDLVEEHLSECEECQNYYDALKEGIPKEAVEKDREALFSEEKMRQAAVSIIKDIKKQISNRRVRTACITAAIALILIFIVEGLNGSYMHSELGKFPPFDTRLKLSDMDVTELYQLENGYLYITVEMKEGSYTVASGNLNDTYDEEGLFTGRCEGEISFTKSLWRDLTGQPRMNRCSFIYPLSGQREEENGEIFEVTLLEDHAIYLEGKGDERMTIWEKGQTVEKAPKDIEEIAKKEMAVEDAAEAYSAAESDEEYSKEDREGRAYVIMWELENH